MTDQARPDARRRRLVVAVVVAITMGCASWVLDSLFRTETGLTLSSPEVSLPEGLSTDLTLDPLVELFPRGGGPFTLRWSGVWYVPTTGVYDLYLAANNEVVVAVDGQRTSSGRGGVVVPLSLEVGFHDLQIDYQQVSGNQSLNLQWAPTGELARRFSSETLFPREPSAEAFATNRRLTLLRSAAWLSWLLVPAVLLVSVRGAAAGWTVGLRSRGIEDRLRSWALAAVIFVTSFGGYFVTGTHLQPLVFPQENAVYSADTESTVKSIVWGPWTTKSADHSLFMIARPLVRMVQSVSPVELTLDQAIISVDALIGALNCLLMFLIIRRLQGSDAVATLGAGFYAVAFSNLVLFSVPETYALGTGTVLLYLYLATGRDLARTNRAVMFGGLAALAGLANLPLLSIALVYVCLVALITTPRTALRLAAVSSIAMGVCFLVGTVLTTQMISRTGAGGRPPALDASLVTQVASAARNLLSHGGEYTAWSHFAEADAVGTTLASFFLFSVVAPLPALTRDLGVSDVVGYSRSALGGGLLVFYLVGLAMAVVSVARASEPIVRAALVWFATMLLFHIYFNPAQAFLYTVQTVPVLVMVLVAGGQCTWTRPGVQLKRLALAAWVGCLAYWNAAAVYSRLGSE